MKKKFMLLIIVSASVTLISFQTSIAQNSSPYWSLEGNNNATGNSKLGTTNSIALKLFTNNLERMRIDAAGKVGIGITPLNIFTVKSSGGTPAPSWLNGLNSPVFMGFGEVVSSEFVLAAASNTPVNRSVFQGRRSRGTLASPLMVAENDYLTSLLASGYDGITFQNPALVGFFVDGVPSPGNVPARISLVTGSNGGNRQERLKVGSTGNFNFNDNQLTINHSTGNVGIGTGNLNFANSLQTIQFPAVSAATSSSMINMFTSGTQNANRMVIAHSPTYFNWGLQYEDTEDKFNFLSGGTPVLTTDLGNWRVGIGNSSPAVRLDVAGTGAWDLATTEGDFRIGNATYRLKMGVATGGGGAGDAYIASANRLFLGAGTTVAHMQTLSITGDGRVGVGTDAPIAKFQVVGGADETIPVIKATTAYTGGSDVRAISSLSKPADGFGYGIESTGGFIGGYFMGSGGAYGGTSFGAYGSASGTAGTRIGVYGTASGGTIENWGGYFPTKTYTNELRVGGTKGATGYVAAINGKLIATEVRVELLANWPDYVFKSGYKLMPIEELEARVAADKHLPGIPAASEMKENGIMLGEMQTKTMEKVEENTLYIIELNNKIKLLEKKIEELTKTKN